MPALAADRRRCSTSLDVGDREYHAPAEVQPRQLAAVGQVQDRGPAQAQHPHRAPGVDRDRLGLSF
jgi:hypothetical protein